MNDGLSRCIYGGLLVLAIVLAPSSFLYFGIVGGLEDKVIIEEHTEVLPINVSSKVVHNLMSNKSIIKIVIEKSSGKIIYTEKVARVITSDTKKFHYALLILHPAIVLSLIVALIVYEQGLDCRKIIYATKKNLVGLVAYSIGMSLVAGYITITSAHATITVGTLLIIMTFLLVIASILLVFYWKAAREARRML